MWTARPTALSTGYTTFLCSHREALVRGHKDRKYWFQTSWFVRLALCRKPFQDLYPSLWFSARPERLNIPAGLKSHHELPGLTPKCLLMICKVLFFPRQDSKENNNNNTLLHGVSRVSISELKYVFTRPNSSDIHQNFKIPFTTFKHLDMHSLQVFWKMTNYITFLS